MRVKYGLTAKKYAKTAAENSQFHIGFLLNFQHLSSTFSRSKKRGILNTG